MKTLAALILGFLVAQAGRGDELAPAKFYTLNFVVQEVDGTRVLNNREYSEIAATEPSGMTAFRAISNLNIQTLQSNYQNYEIGVSIDVKTMKEVNGGLSLYISATVDSLAPDTQPNSRPVIRKNVWLGPIFIQIKKQTVIFSSDDVSSRHKMQLVLTATAVK